MGAVTACTSWPAVQWPWTEQRWALLLPPCAVQNMETLTEGTEALLGAYADRGRIELSLRRAQVRLRRHVLCTRCPGPLPAPATS